jgi:hypothetical protein
VIDIKRLIAAFHPLSTPTTLHRERKCQKAAGYRRRHDAESGNAFRRVTQFHSRALIHPGPTATLWLARMVAELPDHAANPDFREYT